MRPITLIPGRLLAAVTLLLIAPSTVLAHETTIGPPSFPDLLLTWSLDPLPWLGSLLAAGAYLVAVRNVNRASPRVRVPTWRVAAWLGGVACVFLALVSPIDAYADALLSVHMVQHLLLAMVAPPLLALGAPVTVILRVARPEARSRWLLPVLHSRVVRVLASPFVAWALFTAGMFLTHFSPLYNAALEDVTLHRLEHAVFLATGLLFWWPIVAADPIPRRLGYGARLAYIVIQMPVNAAVGLVIYFAPGVLYAHYATLGRTWGPSPIVDQQIAGALMWGAGDLILLATVPLIVAAWIREDGRRTLRADARRLAAAGGPPDGGDAYRT